MLSGSLNKNCADDSNYATVSPKRFACFFHRNFECAKAGELWGYTSSQVTALIESCPESCRMCEHQVLSTSPTEHANTATGNVLTNKPSTPPAKNPSWMPSEIPSVESCSNNLKWKNRFGLGCLDYQGAVCRNMHLIGFNDEEIRDLIANYPETCSVCLKSFFTTKFPTKISSRFPSNLLSMSPSDIPIEVSTLGSTGSPSSSPFLEPTRVPSSNPSHSQSELPSMVPSYSPWNTPSIFPSAHPSLMPPQVFFAAIHTLCRWPASK